MALTQERAEERAAVIRKGSIRYHFHIALQKGNSYSGYAEITFDLLSVPKELALDFKGQTVARLLQNGEAVEPKVVDGFIFLQVDKLKEGINSIGVRYDNIYDNDGSGCVSFIDVDTKQYIYTQFEPYYANRVFPSFDQPDLKATMRLSVISPSTSKKVLSNEYATVQKELSVQQYVLAVNSTFPAQVASYLKDKSGTMTIFSESKLLPTYLYCFVAGQYLELKLQDQKLYKKIPMSLYCIESLYKYMQQLAPFIFEMTIQSMRFYQEFFKYPFPFNKYDQIFAHQYRWGAMENAGVVTFNDLYLFKEKVPTERMLALATTISHELSHHWFGNLVTMKWWDDLWLNESFATFISYFCLQKLKNSFKTIKYQSSMSAFFQRKGRGYNEDQMITTHPIRGKVENTSVADSIFDGITYSKGAATMKQLFYLMGEENFSKALSDYFPKYEWNNATIDQFLAEMQNYFKISEFSLKEWKQMWLQQPSLNVLEAEWDPSNLNDKAKLIIHQLAYTNKHPTLRLHKIKVGFFLQNCEVDILEVLVLPQKHTVIQYNGSKKYKAILLNLEDLSFVKTNIDPTSLDFFSKNITSINDILSRSLIWNSFIEMVKDAKITSHKYVQILTATVANQPSDGIFDKQFDDVHTSINIYTPQKYREQLNRQVFLFIYNLIPKIPQQQQNRLTILKNQLISFATADDSKLTLLKWKNNEDENLKGHEMTLGQQWKTVAKAFTLKNLSLEEKEAIFNAQKLIDSSDTAKNYRLMCDSLRASEEQFQAIYESFKAKDSKWSVNVKSYVGSGWNNHFHKDRLLKYRQRFFKDLQSLIDNLGGDHYQAFYNNLSPIDDDLQSQILQFQTITFPQGRQKNSRDIQKKVDTLKRRLQAYQLYQKASL